MYNGCARNVNYCASLDSSKKTAYGKKVDLQRSAYLLKNKKVQLPYAYCLLIETMGDVTAALLIGLTLLTPNDPILVIYID